MIVLMIVAREVDADDDADAELRMVLRGLERYAVMTAYRIFASRASFFSRRCARRVSRRCKM